MDLETLHEKIKKSPKLYEPDYSNIIQTYQSMLDLPVLPNDINYIKFISLTCHFYSNDISDLILSHFEKEKDDERKKEFLMYLGIIHRKKKIRKNEFIQSIFSCNFKLNLLRIANDLFYDFSIKENTELNHSQKMSLQSIIEQFKHFLMNGTDWQKKTSLFFMIFVYDKTSVKLNREIIEMLKYTFLQNMVIDYSLNLLALSEKSDTFKAKITKNKKRGKKGFDYLKFRKEQKEIKIEKQLKQEKKFHQNKKSALDIPDESKPIVKVVDSEIVLKSVNVDLYENLSNLMEIRKIVTEIKNPREIIDLLLQQIRERKDDRLMRLKKLKLISLIKSHFKISIKINDILLRMIDPSKDDLPLLMHILIRSVEKSEMKNVVTKINHLFCNQKYSDMKCYGLYLLKEVVLIDRSSKIIELVRETADELKKEKTKGVFFAYSTLMRAIKYGNIDKNSVEYNLKRKKIISQV